MKYVIIFILVLQTLSFASDYKIDKSHSTVDFEVTHLVISKVRGTFNQFSGQIVWDQTNLKDSFFNGVVQVSSIDTNNKTRDSHLQSDDFFDAKTHPELTIKTKSITPTDKQDIYELTSDLTLRGITKEVVSLLIVRGPVKDSRGRKRYAFETSLTINRFDYNLKWNNLIESGELVVAEDVDIEIKIQGIELN